MASFTKVADSVSATYSGLQEMDGFTLTIEKLEDGAVRLTQIVPARLLDGTYEDLVARTDAANNVII